MRKIEINNEIVRMRQFVRQARIRVIHKLTREAKTLRAKKGTEKQQEKNRRKADKLINEIYALKKIKDDQITKFGIINKKSLQEILRTTDTDESTRVIARVADHKILQNVIVKFQETYPDYEEYLQSGKKKSMELETKSQVEPHNNIQIKREPRANRSKISSKSVEYSPESNSSSDELKEEGNGNNNARKDKEGNKDTEMESDLEQENSESGSILRVCSSISKKSKHKENTSLKGNKRQKIEPTEKRDDVNDNEDTKNVKRVNEISMDDKEEATVKVISKQAKVKRFTELLQEQSSEKNNSLKETDKTDRLENKLESEKKIDSFFMSGDGDAYLSIAPSMTEENKNLSEDEENNYNNKSRRYANKRTFTNDRFFSNVKSTDAVRRKGNHERRQNDKHFIENKNTFGKRNNASASSFRNETKRRNNDARINSSENENLHPSWAAKKKQQEIVKQGFQGKKIVFEDD